LLVNFMELYTFILVILFGTAIADLIVGVSNDAVNFLNSAVGSKAASRRVIMIIAGLGVLFGTTFSSGMMEIARKGIFNPEFFAFHEVMIIFLAVMLTDILLLDLYNTFGLPTSTTVSIVFEILGGAVAIATIKIVRSGEGLTQLLTYINTAKVIIIIAGIGLSIVFAFIFGSLIQFITRFIFTFNYQKTLKRYGSIYCGIALSIITYFILVKGAKGSSLLNDANSKWIMSHISQIMLYSFITWTVIWQILISFTKINVLKIIVLIGTFALALAFAANDLVNFIGAPVGALGAYRISLANPGSDPLSLTMAALKNPVRANTFILLFAGTVMVATLWLSRKARTVTKTEVSLGRQDEGIERFESSVLSRGIVRMSIALYESGRKITPKWIQEKISERIDPEKFKPKRSKDGEPPAFDLLRAAVNLMVASALVSFGTSLKLPLSTTFVTFMVAMSTSLSDKAWGRESAVYRVTGVLTVIGGWFFTAFMAFSTCFTFALFIYYVKLPAILILLAFGLYFLFRTARVHKKREIEFNRRESEIEIQVADIDSMTRIMKKVGKFVSGVGESVDSCYDGLIHGKRKKLKQTLKQVETLMNDSEGIIGDIIKCLKTSPEYDSDTVPRYSRKIGAIQIINANLSSLASKCFTHIDNNHRVPDQIQASELMEVNKLFVEIVQDSLKVFEDTKLDEIKHIAISVANLKNSIRQFDKNQMRRIKSGKSKTRQSLLFVSSLSRVERIAEQVLNLVKLYGESNDGKVV
jgi:phosphate/sulfate permease